MKNSLTSIFSFGWFKLVLAINIMFAIGWFISDATGITFGWLGAVIWTVITIFSATFGVIYFAQFVTPIAGDEGWWSGLLLIYRTHTSSSRQANQPKTEKSPRRRQRGKSSASAKPAQQISSFKSLRAGILKTHQVAAIEFKNKYVGSRGPGFIQLQEKEKIRQIVDLRTQIRREGNVRVTTRDGIQITTTISVRFRIKPAESSHPEYVLFPYDKNAIFQVSYADAIDDHGDPLYWQEKLVPQAITFATQEVGKYSLNELTSLDNGVSTISEINRIIQQEMVRKFEPRGIDIMDASMGAPVLPEKIQIQRLGTWLSEWQEKTKQKYADIEVETLQQRKEVRARAQIKIIDAISRNLNMMQRDDDAEVVGLITLRMIEALEEAVSDESVKALVPQQIMANLIATTSEQLYANAAGKSEPKPDEPSSPQPPQNNMPPRDEDDDGSL